MPSAMSAYATRPTPTTISSRAMYRRALSRPTASSNTISTACPSAATGPTITQERFIHGEIYKARPDVMAVVHSHTPELVAFGASTVPLRPIMNGATFIGDGLPLFDIRKFGTNRETLISTPALGKSLAQVLGNKSAVLLLGHGAVTVDSSLYGLVTRSVALRENARIEQQAISLGGEVTYLNPLPRLPKRQVPRESREKAAAAPGSIGCGMSRQSKLANFYAKGFRHSYSTNGAAHSPERVRLR